MKNAALLELEYTLHEAIDPPEQMTHTLLKQKSNIVLRSLTTSRYKAVHSLLNFHPKAKINIALFLNLILIEVVPSYVLEGIPSMVKISNQIGVVLEK